MRSLLPIDTCARRRALDGEVCWRLRSHPGFCVGEWGVWSAGAAEDVTVMQDEILRLSDEVDELEAELGDTRDLADDRGQEISRLHRKLRALEQAHP